jgi:hypothetical protein
MNRNRKPHEICSAEPEVNVITNEQMLKQLTGVELACFIYYEQMTNNLVTPVQWSEWLLKPTTHIKKLNDDDDDI